MCLGRSLLNTRFHGLGVYVRVLRAVVDTEQLSESVGGNVGAERTGEMCDL